MDKDVDLTKCIFNKEIFLFYVLSIELKKIFIYNVVYYG